VSSEWQFALFVFLIALNAFFAASEIAIVSMRKTRLRQLVDEGVSAARTVERLSQESSRFLATIQIGVTVVALIVGATAVVNLAGSLRPWLPDAVAGFIATAIVSVVILVFGELVPKNLALRYSEHIALAVADPIDLLAKLAMPVVRALVAITNLITRPFGATPQWGMPFITEEEIKTMVDAGEEEEVLEEEEKEMIYSIFELGDTPVREVMVPRIDVAAVEADASLLEAIEPILREGHSRIPVYEGTIDNVIGWFHAKDALRQLQACDTAVNLRTILRPPYFVPESKKASELLQEMQRDKTHMAIVVDEYGGTAGLVTIEDLLEEIVGEIRDEYDTTEEAPYQIVSPTEGVFDARVNVDDVNEVMSLDLPVIEGSDTLGGLVYDRLGRVPAVGDRVTVNRVGIEVLSVVGRKIKKVRIRKEEAGGE
jgi:putative hemolysin